jgi:hypothetical protein
VTATTSLYDAWYRARRPVELHLYSRGGHGYGVRAQGLPSDAWIDHFHEWLLVSGLVPGKMPG